MGRSYLVWACCTDLPFATAPRFAAQCQAPRGARNAELAPGEPLGREDNPAFYHRSGFIVKSDPPREPQFAAQMVCCARRAVKGKLAALVLRTLDSASGAAGESGYGDVENCD